MLSTYGLGIALRSMLRGRFTRENLKNVIVPVNYWRTLEFRLVHDALAPRATDRILDVGSPKLLSLYLADRIRASVVSTDIERYFLEDYTAYAAMLGLPSGRFTAEQADARALRFPAGTFTGVFSVSVLEHIPGDGDSAAIREMARVLAPGGLLVVTVPFAPESRDEYKKSSAFYWSGASSPAGREGLVFFQRRYSERDLRNRLVAPSGLLLDRLCYLGERVRFGRDRELAHYLPPATGPLQPILSALFHERPSDDWRTLGHALGAMIVLRKPAEAGG